MSETNVSFIHHRHRRYAKVIVRISKRYGSNMPAPMHAHQPQGPISSLADGICPARSRAVCRHLSAFVGICPARRGAMDLQRLSFFLPLHPD